MAGSDFASRFSSQIRLRPSAGAPAADKPAAEAKPAKPPEAAPASAPAPAAAPVPAPAPALDTPEDPFEEYADIPEALMEGFSSYDVGEFGSDSGIVGGGPSYSDDEPQYGSDEEAELEEGEYEDVPAQAAPQPELDPKLRAVDSDKRAYVYIPRNIANMIDGLIPAAKNRNDAVSAFLYAVLNREPVVSEHIKMLAADYHGDSQVTNLKAQIDALTTSLASMTKRYKSIEQTLDQMVTMLVWLVGERMNASIDLNRPATSMDFLFQEHEFIRKQAVNQTAEYAAYRADMEARARFKASAAARDARR